MPNLESWASSESIIHIRYAYFNLKRKQKINLILMRQSETLKKIQTFTLPEQQSNFCIFSKYIEMHAKAMKINIKLNGYCMKRKRKSKYAFCRKFLARVHFRKKNLQSVFDIVNFFFFFNNFELLDLVD